jgi:hypothetical protein
VEQVEQEQILQYLDQVYLIQEFMEVEVEVEIFVEQQEQVEQVEVEQEEILVQQVQNSRNS